jgi:hypothetical protein
MIAHSNHLMLDPRLEISFLNRFAALMKDVILPNVSAHGAADLSIGIDVEGVGKFGIPLNDQDFEGFVQNGKQIDQNLCFIDMNALHLTDQFIVDLDGIIGFVCNQLKLEPKDLDVPCLGLFVHHGEGDTLAFPKVKEYSNGFYMLVQIPDQRETDHSSVIVTVSENAPVAKQKFLLDSSSKCPYPYRYLAS